MTFYISIRPIKFRNEFISPKETLKFCFPEVKFKFECLGYDPKVDGRWLYEITLDSSYSPAESKDISTMLVEDLAMFGARLINTQGAKDLAEKIHKNTWSTSGDALVRPADPSAKK